MCSGSRGRPSVCCACPSGPWRATPLCPETAMSSFGRGLQPSFSLAYRAMDNIGRDRRNLDRWFCGSYRSHVPDQYELGYQICSYSYARFWREHPGTRSRGTARATPMSSFTTSVALKSITAQAFRTFSAARSTSCTTFGPRFPRWRTPPRRCASCPKRITRPIVGRRRFPAGGCWRSRRISTARRVWSSSTLDGPGADDCPRRQRFDPSGARRRPRVVDRVPALEALRAARQFAALLHGPRRGAAPSVAGERRALYPASAGDGLGWVEYNYDGSYAVVVRQADGTRQRFAAPDRAEIHGLAWDDTTVAWYVIVTDDSGMWLGRIDSEGCTRLPRGPTSPSPTCGPAAESSTTVPSLRARTKSIATTCWRGASIA